MYQWPNPIQVVRGFLLNRWIAVLIISSALFFLGTQTTLAASLTISGTLYSDLGVTQITSTKTIKLAVATGTVSVFSTSTDSGAGTWSITIPDGHLVGTSTPITAYVDGDTVKATVATKASSTANITNLDLYQNHVVVSHQASSGTSTTNTDLSNYDNDDDNDIPFTANSDTLAVARGYELYINPGKTFAPGGPVQASSSLRITAGATYTAPATTTVNGTFSNQGTLTAGSGTLTMDAIYSDVVNLLAGRDASGSSGGTGSALINSLTAVGSTLYVGKGNNGTACDGTPGNAIGCELLVFDISSTTNPVLVAGRDASGSSGGTGSRTINSLTVVGSTLYVGKSNSFTACDGTPGNAIGCELLVFDISSTTNPILVAGRDASGSADGTGSITIRSLTVVGSTLYVGKDGSATTCDGTPGNAIGCELLVFDISSTTNPILVAGRDASGSADGTGSVPNYSLTAVGSTLYVGKDGDVTACDGTPGNAIGCELLVFDISSTTNPTLVAGRDASGSSGGTGSVSNYSLTVVGSTLYVGKGFSATTCDGTPGNAIGCEILVFDISSTTNPTLVAGRDSSGSSGGTGSALINSLTVVGSTLYVGKSNSFTACDGTPGNAIGCELLVFDISSTTNPTLVAGRDASGSSGGTGSVSNYSLTVVGSTLYVGKNGDATACDGTPGNAIGCELMLFQANSRDSSVLTGSLTNTNALNHFTTSGTVSLAIVASTTNFTIVSGTTTIGAPISITGSYTNSGVFRTSGNTVTFNGSSAQTLSGTMTDTSSFTNLIFSGAGSKTIIANASTTENLTIQSGATVTAQNPLTVGATFTNAGTFNALTSTLTLQGDYANSGTFSLSTGTTSLEARIKTLVSGRDASGSSGGTGGALIYSLTAVGSVLYVGKSNDSTACDGTPGNAIGCELLVFDISSTTNPVLVAGRDASGSSGGTGSRTINSLTVVGSTLYVGKSNSFTACDGTPGNAIGCELLVFDISSTTNPTLVAARDASGSADGTGNVIINSLTVVGSTLYVGKESVSTACDGTPGNAIGCELLIFDISSTTNPILVAGRDASGNAGGTGNVTIYSLTVVGSTFYVGKGFSATTCDGTPGNAIGCELMVFDISSTTNPILVAGRDASGNAGGTGNVAIYSLTVVGSTFYVGKGFSATTCDGTPGNAIGCELLVFDISSTTNPILVAGRDASGNAGGTGNVTIYSLTAVGSTLYVGKDSDYSGSPCNGTAGNAVSCELMVFDISSTTNPTLVAGRDASGSAVGTGNVGIFYLTTTDSTLYVGKSSNNTACDGTSGNAIGCEFMAFDTQSVLSGTMTGSSAFNNIEVKGNGARFTSAASSTNLLIDTTATTTFTGALSASSILTANAGSQIALASGATTTVGNLRLNGTSLAPIYLSSTASGTQAFLAATSSYSVSYVTVKDSNVCGSVAGKIDVTGASGVVNGGNNTCWRFVINPEDVLTVSGVLYESDRTTPQSATTTVTMALVATSTLTTYSTTSIITTGAFSFNIDIGQLVATATPITLYVDNNASIKAVTVTKTNGSSTISNLDLYQDHVTLKNEGGSGTTTTIANLAGYDSDNDNDNDIQFNASSTTGLLSINANTLLYVASSTHFSPGGAVTVSGNGSSTSIIDGSLHLAPMSIYTAGGNTTLAGSLTASTSAIFNPSSYTTIFNATTTGKTINYASTTGTLGGIAFTGVGGGWSILQNATTTGFNIATGTLTAPAGTLTTGTFANGGTFNNNNGTIVFNGTSSALVGGDAVNSSWATSTFERAQSLLSHNGILYAGLGSGTGDAEVWMYNGSTWSMVGGDAVNSSWATSTFERVETLVSHNNNLYAGLGSGTGDAEVWMYNGSTWSMVGGDAVNSSWATSTYEAVRSLVTYNGNLYAGLGNGTGDAEVWAYNGSTWSMIGGDAVNSSWATSTYEAVRSLVTYNGNLYAGLGESPQDAEVWAYNGSTWTLVGGDLVNSSWDVLYDIIAALTVHNGLLYASLGESIDSGEAEVWAYNGSTWRKVGGDSINSSWGGIYETPASLTSHNGLLYAGLGWSTGGEAEVWAYNGSAWRMVGGDSINSSWDEIYEIVNILISHDSNLYAGIGYSTGDAEVWRLGDIVSGTFTSSSALHDVLVTGNVYMTDTSSTTDLTITQTGIMHAPTTTLSVAGDYQNNGTLVDNFGTINFSGTGAQTIAGTLNSTSTDFASITFTGAGSKTFLNNASTTNFTIGTSSGLVNLPTNLTIAGNYLNNSTLTAGSGTTTFAGGTALATLIGGDAVNSSWTASYEYVWSLTSHNGSLYAGLGNTIADAEVWIYSTTTSTWSKIGGDAVNSSWANGVYETVFSLTSYNGTLYAGLGADTGEAEVWAYNGSNSWSKIGGDATSSSWADVSYERVSSLVSYNGSLYAGLGSGTGDAEVWAYNGLSWTKVGGDAVNSSWATSTYEFVRSLATDNGNLYAGLGSGTGDAEVWAYNGSTWTLIGGDAVNSSWASSTYEVVDSLVSINGTLYAGLGESTGDAEVWAYNGSSWTKVGGDAVNSSWLDGVYEAVLSLTSHNGLLYASLGWSFGAGDAEVWAYNGSTWTLVGGDGVNSSWGNGGYESFPTIISFNGTLYGGLGYTPGDAEVWAFPTPTIGGNLTGSSAFNNVVLANGARVINNNASTTNLTIEPYAILTAPAELSITGSYTNSGTFTAGSGTTTFTGGDTQIATGTMTGASAFGNLSLSGAGTKTFATNASTTNLFINTTASTTFSSALSVGGTLTASSGAKIILASGATTTVNNLVLNGTASSTITLGATATTTQSNFVLTGSSVVSYTTISDSNACGSNGGLIDVSGRNNTAGNNVNCWIFVNGSSTVALGTSYTFDIDGATTTLGTVTLTDSEIPTITATNDIRLSIATTTTNFRFDTSIATLTFGGNASGKVSGTISYEDDGATLLINVTENFTATNTLTIAGIQVGSFGSVSTTTSQLALHTDGNATGTPAALSAETFRIVGTIAITDHTLGQADNQFSFQNRNQATFFAFNLTPTGENATVTDTVITLSGIQEVTPEKLHTFKLYKDNNSDLSLDGGDTLIDSNGIMTINGQHGAITFSTDFLATSTGDYIMTADTTDIERGTAVVFTLPVTGIAAIGVTSGYLPSLTSTVTSIQHERFGADSGGGSGRIGGEAPEGDGDVGGGGSGGGGGVGQLPDGENIAPDPNYYRPAGTGTPDNEWTDPTNAYNSDGTYATASSTYRQSYINFGFNVPLTNTIQGISVKLDASGSTADGTLDVALSWDNGASYTTGKATPTLVGSDIVYTVGGNTDTWGRAWGAGEFASNNFLLRITAAPSSNTLRLDALEIRVHHQATGGGGGGGGRI